MTNLKYMTKSFSFIFLWLKIYSIYCKNSLIAIAVSKSR